MVKYESFISVFGESAIRTLVFSIFTNAFKAFKESDKFSKIFVNGEKIDRIFSAFQLKFYFNDTIQMTKEKKIIIPISGSCFKSKHQVKELRNIYQKGNFNSSNVLQKGKLYMDAVCSQTELEYNLLGDECVVFEADWENVIKSMPKPPNIETNVSELISLIKNHPLFKYLSDFKCSNLRILFI